MGSTAGAVVSLSGPVRSGLAGVDGGFRRAGRFLVRVRVARAAVTATPLVQVFGTRRKGDR